MTHDPDFDPRLPLGTGGLFYGVYPALVIEIVDPDGQGRVKIKLPWSPDEEGFGYTVWARLGTFMGGNNRGSWFIPDVDDEVLVAFEAGNPRRPYVVGCLWNGKDKPPESMDGAGKNDKKTLRSRNGVKITLDDQSGKESLTLETPGGQRITLQDGPNGIKLEDATGNSVEFSTSGMQVVSPSQVKVQASTVEVSAGMVTVNAGMSKFSGVVQCATLITNSVVSASYTPGAGNIW